MPCWERLSPPGRSHEAAGNSRYQFISLQALRLIGTALLLGAVQWGMARPLQAQEAAKPSTPPPDNTLEWVKVAISGAGTLATIVGGVFVFWNVRLTASRLITERFSKAVEQLASDKIEVRLGGIYALERIAKDSRRDHWTIMEVLTAFVREKSPLKVPEAPVPKTFVAAALEMPETGVKVTTVTKDVQAALTVIVRRRRAYDPKGASLNLHSTNLCGADLEDAKLSNANLSGAYLSIANLKGADLRGAYLFRSNLWGANLWGANLYRAKLEGANLDLVAFFGANLRGADLYGARLREARLDRATLNDARLTNANFTNASLRESSLSNAQLRDADLTNANLRNAKELTTHQIRFANLCRTTLPDGTKSDRDCAAIGITPPESSPPPSPPPESPPPSAPDA